MNDYDDIADPDAAPGEGGGGFAVSPSGTLGDPGPSAADTDPTAQQPALPTQSASVPVTAAAPAPIPETSANTNTMF